MKYPPLTEGLAGVRAGRGEGGWAGVKQGSFFLRRGGSPPPPQEPFVSVPKGGSPLAALPGCLLHCLCVRSPPCLLSFARGAVGSWCFVGSNYRQQQGAQDLEATVLFFVFFFSLPGSPDAFVVCPVRPRSL